MTKGLTLIEVLVVIFLMTVLFSATLFFVPRYHIYANFSVEVNKLIDNLRYAREMSVTEQENYSVRFDYQNNQYQVVRYTEEGEEIVKIEQLDSSIKIINIENYSEAKFTLFGAVFKSGQVKLQSDNYERVIYIKPSGFVQSQGSVSH